MKKRNRSLMNGLAGVRLATVLLLLVGLPVVSTETQAMADRPDVNRTEGVGKLDKNNAKEIARGVQRDMGMAVIARHRAATPAVRRFAARVYDQRQQTLGELRQIVARTRLVLPVRGDEHHRQQVARLGRATGKELDRLFLTYIAETDYVNFYTFELNSGLLQTDPELRKFARKQRAILRRDMARAGQLLRELG